MKNTLSKTVLVMTQVKGCLTIFALLLLSPKMMAQIPNSGFENWTTEGSYENPTGWASTNSFSTGSFYAVTKSTDHYPVAIGTYSVRIENNTSLLSNNSGWGMLMTEPFVGDPKPTFPVTGHPTSLTGYYKFTPQNGDTMSVKINLFNAGTIVSENYFTTTVGSANWTSFNVPISNYASADSGRILITPWYPGGSSSQPHGNSILYVDNLNFDNLITSVSKDQTEEIPSKYKLNQNYPNPFNPSTTIAFGIPVRSQITLRIYDLLGKEIATLVNNETLSAGSYTKQWNAAASPSGVYFYRLQAGSFIQTKRLVLLK